MMIVKIIFNVNIKKGERVNLYTSDISRIAPAYDW